jgi:EAL domain-containing protein (putative c-di-GMP-specific phosphodiesterase class I)
MHQNIEDRALVEATVAMAQALSLKVVAEGVENTEHVDILSNLNCDLAQGYLYAKPLPAIEFEAFVESFNQQRRDSVS